MLERAAYAAFGVRWYWIVDPERRSLEVYELVPEGSYRLALECITGVAASVPGCPSLALDLDAMWKRIDELPE